MSELDYEALAAWAEAASQRTAAPAAKKMLAQQAVAIREAATLRAEVERLRGALDFYACADHYPVHGAEAPDVVRNDGGMRARAALSRAKEAGV